MIDGVSNNRGRKSLQAEKPQTQEPPTQKPVQRHVSGEKKQRVSVLQRLKEKQNEIAARYGRNAPEQEKDDMERKRK